MDMCTQRVNGNSSQNWRIGQCMDSAVGGADGGGCARQAPQRARIGTWRGMGRLAQVNAFEFRNAP